MFAHGNMPKELRFPTVSGHRHQRTQAEQEQRQSIIWNPIRFPTRKDSLGFAPGFPYLGGLDPRLGVPRRATPRTTVPMGSVAIARDQSIIYPLETPGGWNLIGTAVDFVAFSPEEGARLRLGDEVRFEAA